MTFDQLRRSIFKRTVWLAALRYGREPSKVTKRMLIDAVRRYDGTKPKRRSQMNNATPSKPAMAKHLVAAGWEPVRRGHEPVFYRDPLDCERFFLRVEGAYALQQKRERAGVVKPCGYCGSLKPPVSGDAAHHGYRGYPFCPDCKGV